ncbi:DUF2304 domain-containing protein [[Clostridium] scindens]|uniref:DUF2304 domain-containing protein n=1 Tax=Clostridium scindens (strain JCM 10418 / VPI 12708) TaxID=29347 RepID=UPI001D090B7D|nr:DUF2304 domain-containing protein [[Clostridium] scindens]MCB7194724.1 DUF2304 domain-containing protein [[Clostridium] scindens]MCB7287910.1 DUF2304 domain-containing protein [[Clostridium] scindens]MCQ5289552.1 DUF2304 domain-containing protein [[Clostridium] scindens]
MDVSGLLRILLIVSAVLLLIFMLKRIRYAKLKIEYAVFWIAFAAVLVIMGVFPQLCYIISDFIGFQSPISMVFLIIIFVMIVKMFFMTLNISNLENKVDNLTQQIAIDRKQDKDERKTESKLNGDKIDQV